MNLEDLGYDKELEIYRRDENLEAFDVGRVISEHKERYTVKTTDMEYQAEIVGNLRYAAEQRADFPAVGDWVAVSQYDDDKALIHHVFPRKTIIERQAVGKYGEKQIIATNIDYALVVQAVDRDFSLNRVERYLTICNSSNVVPIILLNKIDLISEKDLSSIIQQVRNRVKNNIILAISNETKKGIEELKKMMVRCKTYCLLGSSGVGKSSLLNNLYGGRLMNTNTISSSSNRGRHITSHRELVILDNGSILIDNPGMREVGIVESSEGLEETFSAIVELSRSCRFKDCTHIQETGCAVIEAIENGEIDHSSYENYLKMEREREHFESTALEKRKKDREFGKMIKQMKKDKKKF